MVKNKFTKLLLKWNAEQNIRQMPWKGEKDPYKIWISEIILQQTRVEQGLNYYNNFINAFPNVNVLANTSDGKIFKLWEGLGYYTRCSNLIATARYIAGERKGKFPDTYDELKKLKGVGPYTAAAIASFAYELPQAVVDGNVYRVLARVFGIKKPIDSSQGKFFFNELAKDLLDKKQPGLFNQAIMDFGAVVCKPSLPGCTKCIFKKDCFAFLNNSIDKFPLKEKKIKIKKRFFYYFMMEYQDKIVLRQRTAKDIWQQLFEFPVIETVSLINVEDILNIAEKKGMLRTKEYKLGNVSPVLTQQLTHQLITGQIIKLRLNQRPDLKDGALLIKKNLLYRYSFPKFINQYFEEIRLKESLV